MFQIFIPIYILMMKLYNLSCWVDQNPLISVDFSSKLQPNGIFYRRKNLNESWNYPAIWNRTIKKHTKLII